MPLPLGIWSAIEPLAKTGIGLWQLSQYNKLKNAQRPTFEIPEAQKQSLGVAQSLASQTQLPGQGILENKLTGQMSQGIGAMQQSADSPSAILGGIAGMVGQSQSQMGDLAGQAAQNYQQQQQNLQGALGTQAEWENKAWDYNVNQPYQNKMATASAMLGASQQNLMGAGTDVAGIGNNMQMNKLLQGIINPQQETQGDIGGTAMGAAMGGAQGAGGLGDYNKLLQMLNMMKKSNGMFGIKPY